MSRLKAIQNSIADLNDRQRTELLNDIEFTFGKKPKGNKRTTAPAQSDGERLKHGPNPAVITKAPRGWDKVQTSVEPEKKVSEGMKLAAGYSAGSSADCPFCARKNLISPSNGVVTHPKRTDVMKQTFAACKHTINVPVQ
jgi:hypothetical protein